MLVCISEYFILGRTVFRLAIFAYVPRSFLPSTRSNRSRMIKGIKRNEKRRTLDHCENARRLGSHLPVHFRPQGRKQRAAAAVLNFNKLVAYLRGISRCIASFWNICVGVGESKITRWFKKCVWHDVLCPFWVKFLGISNSYYSSCQIFLQMKCRPQQKRLYFN